MGAGVLVGANVATEPREKTHILVFTVYRHQANIYNYNWSLGSEADRMF